MEFASCEQYVLAEMSRVESENERLRERIAELERGDKFERECDAITAKTLEEGRRALFRRCTKGGNMPASEYGRMVPFDEWRRRYTLEHAIDFCSVDEFMDRFSDEFEAAYIGAMSCD